MTLDRVEGRLWAQRLKRVFNLDIETCSAGHGAVLSNGTAHFSPLNSVRLWLKRQSPSRSDG